MNENTYAAVGGKEVDFYLPESRALIQVSQSLAQPATREREVRALIDAMRSLGLDRELILTDSNEAPITENGFTIAIRSLIEWLLRPEPPRAL